MPAVAVTALKSHRKRQLEERLAAGREWQDLRLIFTSPLGTPLDSRHTTRELIGLLQAANLPAVRFHDLRHIAASLLLAQGVDPRAIMETLGHSQISLTLNTYSHVLPTLQADAAAKLSAILTR
jgi:integrase